MAHADVIQGAPVRLKLGRDDWTQRAVMADRNADYAPPEENFQRIADLWNLYLEGKGDLQLAEEQYRKLHASAHDNCFIANSIKSEVTIIYD